MHEGRRLSRPPCYLAAVSLPAEVIADLQERVRMAVAGGYDNADNIVEDLVELVEYDPETEALVAAEREGVVEVIQDMVDAQMAQHAAAEMSFPPMTDCDRLSAAFATLEADGIICREDVGYTQSDLQYDMWELVDRLRSDGASPRGWAAFHRQDVERAVTSGKLYIAFASMSDDDEGFRAIGSEVAGVLAGAGLTVNWNSDPNARIQLVGLRWEKRLAT